MLVSYSENVYIKHEKILCLLKFLGCLINVHENIAPRKTLVNVFFDA